MAGETLQVGLHAALEGFPNEVQVRSVYLHTPQMDAFLAQQTAPGSRSAHAPCSEDRIHGRPAALEGVGRIGMVVEHQQVLDHKGAAWGDAQFGESDMSLKFFLQPLQDYSRQTRLNTGELQGDEPAAEQQQDHAQNANPYVKFPFDK